jgi:hypothetical protein
MIVMIVLVLMRRFFPLADGLNGPEIVTRELHLGAERMHDAGFAES